MPASIRKKIVSARDRAVQWLWFALGIQPQRVGFGKGPLTWLRERQHTKLRRKVHICLLDYCPGGGKGRLTTFWINERSRACTCSVDDKVQQADIVWICSQDPINGAVRQRILETLNTARCSGAVINHPDMYNCYHCTETFKLLAKAGVNVPRCEFDESDIGTAMVVYKTESSHGAHKFLSKYKGHRAGYRTFEFIDGRGDDGLYKRYRAFYLLGAVWPSTVMYSRHWNVSPRTMVRRDFDFGLTETEAEQVGLLARTLDLQFFAVDFVRRKSDALPVFTDINIYPDLQSWLPRNDTYGKWHTWDNFSRLGGPHPLGRPFWDVFDEKMLNLAKRRDV